MEVQSRKSVLVNLLHEDSGNSDSPSKKSKKVKPSLQRWKSWCWDKLQKVMLVAVIIGNIAGSIWIMFFHGNLPEIFPGDHIRDSTDSTTRRCHVPELKPFPPELKYQLSVPSKIDCQVAANSDFHTWKYFTTDRENHLIRLVDPLIPCCYRPFYRVNEGEVWIEPITTTKTYRCHNITQRVTNIPPEHEYIEVICDNKRKIFRDGFAFVPRKPKVDQRVHEIRVKEKEEAARTRIPKSDKLSVIVFGWDSTSQLNFIRRMPKTVEFLTNDLRAIKLKGYNKVGENTLPNVVPLLTGLELEEFKDRCVEKHPPFEGAVHIDHCPFIWKNFSDAGYYTSFAEDEVPTAIFNLHWSHSFLEPPTDHYLRPYSLRMHDTQNSYDGLCLGTRLSFEPLLDNLEKAAVTYKDDLMFHFTWASKLTHDDLNRLTWADRSFLKTLRFLYENGNLNRTVMFILGDHGSRKAELRKTRHGQLEDRLPLGWILVPPWFEKKYPRGYQTLLNNADTLSSAYDVYETLLDFMDLSVIDNSGIQYARQTRLKVAEKKGTRRGTSLLTKLPEYRGCTSAGVPPHWCMCYKKHSISLKSPEVYDAMGFIIRSLNNMLISYGGMCAKLTARKITSALKWHPDDSVQDSFNGNSEENYKRSSLYEVAFDAQPGGGQFEATVLFEPDNGWKLTEQVVRLDKYNEQSHCMHKEELKKICYCINQPGEPDALIEEGFP